MWLSSGRIIALFSILMIAFSNKAAVVLQYHHVSDTTPTSTSISVEMFAVHMSYLANNQYQVMPLKDIISQLKQGKKLAPKTVAITFDDGYLNVLTHADPILKQHEFSYTLFIAPNEIDKGHKNMLNWLQIKSLAESGVDIANHSSEHLHLNRQLTDETIDQWQQRITDDIEQAELSIIAHQLPSLKLLAYPYGEYNTELQNLVSQLGYVGIGQHSGALSNLSDLTALPRFPASGRFSNIETLAVKLKSLAMPVTKLVNANPQLDQHQPLVNPPMLTIKLDTEDVDTRQLHCYILGQLVEPKWLNKQTFTITATNALPIGRSRYNCTAPSYSDKGYYWFSQPWINRNADGSWYQG